jgi:hypothetical protein
VEVDAVGSNVEGELGRPVDEDAGLAFCCADGLDHAGCQELKLGEGQVFFAKLNGVDAATGPFLSVCDEGIALCVLVSIEEATVRDGVEEHLRDRTAEQALV